MFRARIGNQNSSGNKVLNAKLEKKKDEERARRIAKIKSRKPGSSKVTLDNTPPVIIEAMKSNPRKKALQINFNIVTEKENMCMLKRISAILTAPPKITDAEYKTMRKLCPTLRGLKEVYEHNIILSHNKQFFKRLKNTQAYYNPHEWERDYQLQKKGQKFMRQVNYERPKGFVDPYGLDDVANLAKINSVSGSMETREPAANHVSRVRNIKANNASAAASAQGGDSSAAAAGAGGGLRKSHDKTSSSHINNNNNKRGHANTASLPHIGHGGHGHDGADTRSKSGPLFGSSSSAAVGGGAGSSGGTGASRLYSNSPGRRDGRGANSGGRDSGGGGRDSYENEFEEEDGNEEENTKLVDPNEKRIELCSIRRSMRVVDFLTAADLAEFPPEDLMDHISPRQAHGVEAPIITVDMDVKCFLVNNVDLVISAITCQGQPIFVDAEAEAPVSELCALKGVPYHHGPSGSDHGHGHGHGHGAGAGAGASEQAHSIEQDMLFIESLEGLARDIASTVEIKVEDEIPRLVLNIFEKKLPFDDDEDYYDGEFEAAGSATGPVELTGADVEALLLDPVVIDREMPIKVKFLVQHQVPAPQTTRSSVAYGGGGSGGGSATITLTKEVFEDLSAHVHIQSSKDDKVDIKIRFLQASETKHTKKPEKRSAANVKGIPQVVPAVDVGAEVSTSTGLPSITQADKDLVAVFFENLTTSLLVEHNATTGEGKLILKDEMS